MIIDHLSPSSMADFESCPSLFKATRIDKLPKPPGSTSPAMQLGIDVEHAAARLLGFKTGSDDFGSLSPAAPKIVEQYSLHEQSIFQRKVAEYQRPIAVDPIAWSKAGLDPLPIPITGFTDFILEDGAVVDLKVGRAAPSREVVAGWVTQMVTYAVALGTRSTEIHKIKTLKSGAVVSIYPVKVQPEDIAGLHGKASLILDQIDLFSKTGFPERVNFKCSSCPAQGSCITYLKTLSVLPPRPEVEE